jgi:hypothetical protein
VSRFVHIYLAIRDSREKALSTHTTCNRSSGLLSLLLCGGFYCAFPAASGAAAVVAAPTTIHVIRTRTSYDHTASKFTYYGNYTCLFSKYWIALAEPEPKRSQLAKQRALASAAPVSTYSAADEGEVEEYFAPGRYVRYERSTTFVQADRGACTLRQVNQTKVQLAQGTRLINATTENGATTVSEIPLRPVHEPSAQETAQAGAALARLAPAWGGGFAPGTVSKVGEKIVAGEACDLMSSAAPTFGMATDLCVWRGIKTYLTPLGPKEIVLFLESRPSATAQPTTVTDPIVLNTAEVLHWTEQAREFSVNESFADAVFTTPKPTTH